MSWSIIKTASSPRQRCLDKRRFALKNAGGGPVQAKHALLQCQREPEFHKVLLAIADCGRRAIGYGAEVKCSEKHLGLGRTLGVPPMAPRHRARLSLVLEDREHQVVARRGGWEKAASPGTSSPDPHAHGPPCRVRSRRARREARCPGRVAAGRWQGLPESSRQRRSGRSARYTRTPPAQGSRRRPRPSS